MDVQKWLILPLLYLLPFGVFSLAISTPEIRPAAIQFAHISFGALLATFGSTAATSYKSKTKRVEELPTMEGENE